MKSMGISGSKPLAPMPNRLMKSVPSHLWVRATATPPTTAPVMLFSPPTTLPAMTEMRNSSEKPTPVALQRGIMPPARPERAPAMNHEATWTLNVSTPRLARATL